MVKGQPELSKPTPVLARLPRRPFLGGSWFQVSVTLAWAPREWHLQLSTCAQLASTLWGCGWVIAALLARIAGNS